MGSSNQQPNHAGLVKKMGTKKEYTNYVMNGGTADFPTWKKENKK